MDPSSEPSVRLLSQVPAGQRVRLIRVFGGHGLTLRLAGMGLVANAELEVLRNDFHGQIIVQVKNTKLVLGRGMSDKLHVAVLQR